MIPILVKLRLMCSIIQFKEVKLIKKNRFFSFTIGLLSGLAPIEAIV